MKLNQKLIQQLRNGEIAVENNGTLEQLREVIKEAFPKDKLPPGGTMKYYKTHRDYIGKWGSVESTTLPTISVTNFYQPELFTGWAKDDRWPNWMGYFKNDVANFGFDSFGLWVGEYNYECNYSEHQTIRPATHKEIENHLTQEAKRRGYRSGNYKCLELPRYTHDVADVFYYNEKKNKLHHGEEGVATNVVFKNGQWAEVVEQPKPKTNPIHYTVDGTTYSLNYQELKAKYESVVNYSDEQFMGNLPEIAHLSCIISYFKGLGNSATISDKGIIHEIMHLMTDPDEPTNDLGEIREKFNRLIKLV